MNSVRRSTKGAITGTAILLGLSVIVVGFIDYNKTQPTVKTMPPDDVLLKSPVYQKDRRLIEQLQGIRDNLRRRATVEPE